MKAAPEVTCIGEVLVDFVSLTSGVSLMEAARFQKYAGGAPANVAVGLARLGTRAAFVGTVGRDSFGRFLSAELHREGVDVRGLRFDKEHRTRLAFVSLKKSGDRDFEFWEKHPADEQLRLSEAEIDRIALSKVVHISSFLLLAEPARSTALRIAREMRRRGCDVSFDPNLRLSLWKSERGAKHLLLRLVEHTSILRLNEEEAQFLTGTRDVETAAEKLLTLGPSLVVATLGSRGCYFQSANRSALVRGYKVKVVDTTGCGDGFLAGLLHGFVQTEKKLPEFSVRDLESICRCANAVGALTATRRGAVSALPDSSEVTRFLRTQSKVK